MSKVVTPSVALPEADAGRRNMSLLIQLRWLAVGGQLLTILVVSMAMDIRPPLAPLLGAIAILVAINLASQLLVQRGRAVTNIELTAALLLDVAVLGWQLHHSGGLANPFASLFLLQIVIGAILLTPRSSWMIVAATLVTIAALRVDPTPLVLPTAYAHDPMGLYLAGSLVCFVLIAVLLVAFVTRISRNLSERDAALAASRQRAAEEDHIVRMGLLASGAAHELGTPLSTLSVLIGDWKAVPRLADDREVQEDLVEMDIAVRRCKAIVSGILMSAGEARGEAPQLTTMRAFLAEMVAHTSAVRRPGTVEFNDRFGADVAIVSDPALRQVIGNVLDNAAEVSPDWTSISASRDGDMVVIEIADRGPGFSEDMLESFGQPYRSTKGRPGGGLGLFLLVNVLRKLGGGASVSNRDAGGALVRIFSADFVYSTTGRRNVMSGKRQLLIVEDDEAFARTLKRSFERRDYEVRVAHSPEELAQSLEGYRPGYAVVDLKLGGASGLACVQTLRAVDAAMRIVVLTGFASIATAVEAIKLGASYYLAKPSNTDDIEAAFDRAEGNPEAPLDGRQSSIKTVEWEHIHQTLVETDFNISETARRLGMHRRTLARKLEKRQIR